MVCAASSFVTAPHIGIFDSGVGGLSILRALLARQTGARFTYVADTAHAPYGQRSTDEVLARARRLSAHLLTHGARCVVVACNTATTQTIAQLRAEFPQAAFVGVEPGVKPAAALTRSGRIGVMATPGTLASERFATLVARHAQHCEVVPVACPGLASAIEEGLPNPRVDALLDTFCLPLRQTHVDVVALGCTHYPFVAEQVARRLGSHVQIVDTADAVARRTFSLLNVPLTPALGPSPELHTTGDADVLARHAHTLLGADWLAKHIAA